MNVSDWTAPGSVTQSGAESQTWANASNAADTDGAWATQEMQTSGSGHRSLHASGYVFDVPGHAVLVGIEVKLRRSLILTAAEGDYVQTDNVVRVVNDSVNGSNKATAVAYPKLIDPSGGGVTASDLDANAFERQYGGASDLWTLARVLVADFDPTLVFQAAHPVNKDAAFATLGVDSMLMRIYWTDASPSVRIV